MIPGSLKKPGKEVSRSLIEEIKPDDINSEDYLFGEGLGLDSIDSLELGLAVKKHFKVPIDSDSEETREHFASVKTLASFIDSHR